MPTPVFSSFSASMENEARHRELQMWQAAQTVRAHVPVNSGLAAMLDCLGLTDAQRPKQQL